MSDRANRLGDEIAQLRRQLTELQASQARLEQTEEQLRFMHFSIEHAPEGAFWVGPDARFLYVNDTACRTLGYSREELLSMTLRDIDPYFSAEAWPEKWQLTQQGGTLTFESRHRTKDGKLIPVEITSSYLEFNGKGYACAFARDISARKKAAKELKESENRLRAIFESAPISIKLLSQNGILVEMNQAGLAMVEADRPELVLGRPIIEFIVPEYRDTFTSCSQRVLLGEKVGMEYEIIGLKGTRRLLESHATPLRNAKGEICVLAVALDATDHRRAKEALVQSEERYRELFENANDTIFTIDLQGNFTSVNNAGERVLGYSREEALRMNIANVLPPGQLELARGAQERSLRGEDTAAICELEINTKNGKQIPLEISPSVIHREGKPVGFQFVARDVSERRRLEDRVRASQKMEAVGRLAGGVAHDFNNLLTAVLGYSDLLLTEIEPGLPMREDVEAIKKAGQRAAMLTRQLLAFSRRQILLPQLLDLNVVVSNLDKILRRLLGEDIDLVFHPGEGLGIVKADPGQIEQVLLNLAINSRDAMPRGGKLVIQTANAEVDRTEALRLGLLHAGLYVVLSVTDTGPGIDEAARDHLFEPFFTTKEQGKGTGLGLSTVYGTVKQSGGSIAVESEPDKGARFSIYLPRADGVIKSPQPPAAIPASLRGSETVLVVEDEDAVRDLVRSVLRTYGYNVLEARHGVEALQVIGNYPDRVHLVLTDLVMPRMGGLQLAEQLAQLHPGTKMLYMSGYTDSVVFREGAFDLNLAFLQKPFSPEVLVEKTRSVLDS